MSQSHYIYILASKRRGALYIGVTDDLANSVLDHKANLVEGLTSLYAIHNVVYYEQFEQAGPALLRQSELRKMSRALKLLFIERHNPDWCDLYEDIVSEKIPPGLAVG